MRIKKKEAKAIRLFLMDAYYSHEITPQDFHALIKRLESMS